MQRQRHMPLGYTLANGKIEVDIKKAQVIKEIFNVYMKGSSIRKIAEDLTAKGFPNANNKPSWNHGSIGRILENTKYLGDEIYEQIIDEETFKAVQRQRKLRGRQYSRTYEINKRKKESIFIEKLICGECGEYYRQYITNGGKPEEEIQWKCNNHSYQRKMKCKSLILEEEDIEEIFIAGSNTLLSRMWMLDRRKKEKPPKFNMEIRVIEDKIRELEEDGMHSSEELAKLIFQRAKAYYDISKIDDYDYNTEKIKEGLRDKEKLIEFDEDLFKRIIKKIIIYKDGKIEVKFINGIIMEEEYKQGRKEEEL